MSDATATTDTKKFQRKTMLVKRGIQFKFVALIFFSVVFAVLLVGGDIYYTMYRALANENPSLMPMIQQANSLSIVKMILYLVIIVLISLFVSHRMAGPIYRFEKSAQIVGTGDLTHRVSLRTGDDLLDLQEEFNSMVASLQAQVQKERSLASRLTGKIDQLLSRLPDESQKDWAPVRAELKDIRSELEHITSRFKV